MAQVLVRDLEGAPSELLCLTRLTLPRPGRTRLLDFGARHRVPVTDVYNAVAAACLLPAGSFRLATGSLSLRCDGDDLLSSDGLLPSCSVLLTLCGGKVRPRCSPTAERAR